MRANPHICLVEVWHAYACIYVCALQRLESVGPGAHFFLRLLQFLIHWLMDVWLLLWLGWWQFVIGFGSLLMTYGILWVSWAPTGIMGAHLIWMGIWLEHYGDDYEELGDAFEKMGHEMRYECLRECGWLAPVPAF
jgi:hypothetical protein